MYVEDGDQGAANLNGERSLKSSGTMEQLRLPVAIIGMSLRVPGARTLEQFWDNLVDGRDCLHRASRAELEHAGISPQALSDPRFIAARPLLDGIEYFDADFFEISGVQAEQMDPGHRLFLECVWEAMERGGVVPGSDEQNIGVFAGIEANESSYLYQNLRSSSDENAAIGLAKRLGNSPDYLSLRVSHELNLTGPSFTTMATCSTSLLAAHLGVQNLRLRECRVAVAGGAVIGLPATPGYRAGIDGMLSPSGRVRPFDADADGTVFGSGVAVVVMKLLDEAIKDGNPIYGVVLGSGFCNDGKPADKNSFTAPAPSGQKRAIMHALDEAEVDARTIGFVECHGTGTAIGDPTEVTSLTEVFRSYSRDTEYCALGAVKGNVGHLGSAAGVVSLIKTCLVLSKGVIPPVANFHRPNPDIDFEATPFFVNTRVIPWAADHRPKRAGVSAFGFGGANVHLVLEEYVTDTEAAADARRSNHLLVVSAKNQQALQRRLSDLASFIEDHPDIPRRDIAHTLQCGRQAMPFRSYVYVDDRSRTPVADQLRNLKPASAPCRSARPVVFLFPGQGSQAPGMGLGLYENEPVYRETIDYCAKVFEGELGFDLRKKIYPGPDVSNEEAGAELTQTSNAQPALFMVEYALARQYEHWGLRPTALLGHSLGELVAACLAGVYSLDDGLRMVALRSRLMQKCAPGSMVAVLLPLSELLEILPGDLDLAAANSPTRNVVSGPTVSLERFVLELKAKGIGNQALATSRAFHSRMQDAILEEYRRGLAKIAFSAPQECIISNVTGLPMTESQACDPNYWVNQLRQPVRFSDGLSNFLTAENPLFVEMGPDRVLSGFVSQHDSARNTVSPLYRPREDMSANAHRISLDSLGLIWSLGADIDWSGFYSPEKARKISLPTYPFQEYSHWLDLSKSAKDARRTYPLRLYEPGWRNKEIAPNSRVADSGRWLIFADDEGVADRLLPRLKESARTVTVVEFGDCFRRVSDSLYELVPGSREDLRRVISKLSLAKEERLRVLHFWTLTGTNAPDDDRAAFEESCDKGFHTLIALTQAAHDCGFLDRMDVQIYVDGLVQVNESTDALHPDKGTLLGPCRVIPQEIPGLTMRCIDIPGSESALSEGSLIDDIFRESTIDCDDVLIALRPDGRFSEELFELPEIAHGLPRLRRGGTVLITGGVGGLGLKIAEYLYDKLKTRLVLTSRWQAPPREEWSKYEGQDTKIGRAIRVLARLIDRNAEVLIVQADVSQRDDMERVIDETSKAFGRIHGIVHTAGILDDGPVLQKTRDSADKVFAAKVASAYILEELFEDQPLDMFVHFSSQASMRPGKGQVDYSAANAVLDRLARRYQQKSSSLGCAVAWGPWRDAGMAWEYTGSTDLGLSSLFQDRVGTELEETYREIAHPVLKTYRRYNDDGLLFTGSLTRGEHWVAEEHLVQERPVISASTILELFRAGFTELCPNTDAIEFTRIVFAETFVVDDATDYEILFVRDNDGYNVELRTHSSGTGQKWVTNSKAVVRAIPAATNVDPRILEKLASIRGRGVKPCEPMLQGPRWHCDWIGEKDGPGMVARVRLPEPFHHEVEQFGLHPAILDRSIHFVMEALVGTLLPYTCRSFRIYGRMPAETLVYCRPSDDEDDACDLLITDPSGNLLVQIESYMLRPFAPRRWFKWRDYQSHESPHQERAMVLGKSGHLNSFAFEGIVPPSLKPEEVRIDVMAAGLNFRDVLSALGQLPEGDDSRDTIGSECSGIIVEVGENVTHLRQGDRVVAVSSNCFASTVVADAHAVTYLPATLSFTEGAGIPITFLTVDYALNQLAQLQAGERILIHAAAGGIGLAAVQLAQKLGAEIIATAGHESKRRYLNTIGIEHVMDSRSLEFVEQVQACTNGEGVDVVLNALAGEFIPASLGLLKPFGRFLEIGKRDIYADSQLGLYPFRNNLSYFGVDLGQLVSHRQKDLQRMFEKLMQRFATGELRPSPTRVFPLSEIGAGFEYIARAHHIGKVVFSVESDLPATDVALERFRARFGNGIRVDDGLEVFGRLLSSDEAPPCVMAVADAVDSSEAVVRYQSRAALTRPVDTPFREPRNTNEEILKQIWERNLGISPIGIDDDFIELGGDSVSAIMVQVAVGEAFDVELSLPVLFRYSSIAKLAKLIDEEKTGKSAAEST